MNSIISTFIVLNSLNILLSSTPNLLMLFTIIHALLVAHNLVSLIFKIYTPQLISLMLSLFFSYS